MVQQLPSWICCQIGARRHYAIPRALYQVGQLAHLVTDAWVSPRLVPPLIPTFIPVRSLTRLSQRFHIDLSEASVRSFTTSLIHFELAQQIQRTSEWKRIIARNTWFQQKAVQLLDSSNLKLSMLDTRPTLFAYSYAALELFRYAKTRGWRTILGQIDPGPVEEDIVREEHIRHPGYHSMWQPAPTDYWIAWREECSLADRIVVSSSWSSQALQQVGISANKIDIIPLAYEIPDRASGFERTYPQAFSVERPLRVLFLGQVILRKGITALLEAAELLRDQPIEFWLVGPQGIVKPKDTGGIYRQVRWIGAVPRSQASLYYQKADVFLFPTLSDGFGLTQLEAQAWKLPIIASCFCGEVVKDQENGLLLREVAGEAIAEALQLCLNNPRQLEAFAQQSTQTFGCFSLLQLQHHLLSLPDSI